MNSVGGRRTQRGGYYLYYPPLGLCSIAAAARADGFAPEVFDAQFMPTWPDNALRLVAERKPAVVGIAVVTPTLPVSWQLIQGLRRLRESSDLKFIIAAGGAHISCDPEILPDLGADFGVVGDGEDAIRMIAAHAVRGEDCLDSAPGLIRHDGNGSIRINDPAPPSALRTYPVPARDLLQREKYFNPIMPAITTSVISARGCPFQCAFCCRSQAMGTYRPRPVDAFLDEMQSLNADNYGYVSVIDETFTYDRARAAEIAEGLMRMKPKFAWSCQTRADAVDAETIGLLRRAGCVNISFGVEAGDASVRRGVEKDISDNDFVRAFSLCREAGITTNAFVIIGSPGEGADEIMSSVTFLKKLDPDYAAFNIGTLFPGSGVYDKMIAEEKIERYVWTRYMRGETEQPLLSDRLGKPELAQLLSRSFSAFYLRPSFMLKRFREAASSPRRLWHIARRAATIVGDYMFS